MKLHETLNLQNGLVQILRVSGGWIYRFWEDNIDKYDRNNYRVNSVFVPYSQELNEIKKFCQVRWKEGNMNIVCGEELPCSKHGWSGKK